jgi:hypothetical protein
VNGNPYGSAINRWFQVVAGALGSAAALAIVIGSLLAHRAPGLTRWTAYQRWSATDNPVQFWFLIGFWLIACAVMARVSWKAYREWDA